jgi:hypothetical protein
VGSLAETSARGLLDDAWRLFCSLGSLFRGFRRSGGSPSAGDYSRKCVFPHIDNGIQLSTVRKVFKSLALDLPGREKAAF